MNGTLGQTYTVAYDLASNRLGRRSGWDANGDGLISGSEPLDQTLPCRL